MAENVTNKNKPTASNKYSLYAGREEAVNWGQVAVNLTKGLETIRDQRAAAKQKIIDDTNAAMNELSEIADVQSGSMNTLLIDGSDFSKNTLQANMDLVRRGLLDPKDYMLIMQQQKDGYKTLSNYAKNYDAKYQEGMARIQDGSASNLEEYFRSTGFSFGNVKNKKLWTDPATGELFLVEMQDDGNGNFTLPDRATNPGAFQSPSSMVNMIAFQENSRNLSEDVKNMVTANLAEVVTSTISSYTVLSGGKDVKSIEDFRQLFDDVEGEGFTDAQGNKMTFDDWMGQQAKAVVGNANGAAEYLMNANMGYYFTDDENVAKKDKLAILTKTDGGPPQVTISDEQMNVAENLAKNAINSQLDMVVKNNAGLGGQQESGTGAGERKENETTAGYISDLNTVLTGDVATAKQTLQGLIETRNVQNKANNQPTIDGFDMTEDFIIFYMSDGNNIRRERGTFDDPDTTDDETSKTSISQDIAGIYDVLVPGGQGVKTGLSDQQIFDFIKEQKINIGTEAGEGFGIGESITEVDNIGTTTQKKFADNTTGTILSIVDDDIGDTVNRVSDTDEQVKNVLQKSFTNFQTKSSRLNQQRAGITDLKFNNLEDDEVSITFMMNGKEQTIKVGDKISANGTTKETIAQAIADAINKFNKIAYDEATKKGGSRGARKTFKDWQVDNPKEEGESFQDYVKRYYNSYTLN
tara:strand:- start:2244 stop:4328 length:2085 start_codon:yes stop_codon:yes gene_type:complete